MQKRGKRVWLAVLAGVALPAVLAVPAPAYADCAQALGMLQAQLRLITAAEPLNQDREAALQSVQAPHHEVRKALTDRTKLASRGLADEASRPSDRATYEKAVADTRTAIETASQARNRGDEEACQQAVSDGLDAARRARISL